MRHSGLIKLVLKVVLALAPLLVPVIIYVIFDPFQVLRHHDRYYSDPSIVYNRDYISTEIFMANYPKEHYDSFIFGNSRSLAFLCRDWQRYINAKGIFHFDANAESLYGIYKKIMFLDRQGVRLSNCLLVLDEVTVTKIDNNSGHLLMKHPKISQESILDFQMEFVRAFLTPRYFMGYLDYKIHDKVRPKFSKMFMPDMVRYDPVTNDIFMATPEEEITRNRNRYYEKRQDIFYKRELKEKKYSTLRINDTQKRYFEEIKRVFEKDETNYRIIINPLYDQIYFNRTDLAYLEKLFGKNNVFDYSGVNEYTNSVYNYYETSHYRPEVARQILQAVYHGNH